MKDARRRAGEVGARLRLERPLLGTLLLRVDDGPYGVREHVQHGTVHPRVQVGDHLLVLEEPLALPRGLPDCSLQVRLEPTADLVHRGDSRRDRFARGFGGEKPLRVARGSGAGAGYVGLGRDLRFGDVDVGGSDLGLEVLDAAGDLGVAGAGGRLEGSFERGDGVVVFAVGLEGHAAAEVGLLPVGAELDAHVGVGQRLLDLLGHGDFRHVRRKGTFCLTLGSVGRG